MTDVFARRNDPHEFLWEADGIHKIPVDVSFRGGGPPHPAGDFVFTLSKAEEARRFPRLDLKFPVLYKVLPETSTPGTSPPIEFSPTQGGNISGTGAGLVLAEHLPRGTLVELSIHLEPRRIFGALGRVVWSRSLEAPHHHLTGFDFMMVYRKDHGRTEFLTPKELETLFF